MTDEQHLLRLLSRASADYGLLEDGDRVLVAVSGGKDSMVLARLLALRSRILKPRFCVEAAHVVMDNIGKATYNGIDGTTYETNEEYLRQYCAEVGIPLHLLHTSFDASEDKRHTPCFLCSWTRRKTLFNFAQQHGFNKIALGHHQDDLVVTLLMNMTFTGSMQSMAPLMKMEKFPISIIRPLCLVSEDEIRRYASVLDLQKPKRQCPYEQHTQRHEMTAVLRQLESLSPEARQNIFRAMQNIKPEQLPVPLSR